MDAFKIDLKWPDHPTLLQNNMLSSTWQMVGHNWHNLTFSPINYVPANISNWIISQKGQPSHKIQKNTTLTFTLTFNFTTWELNLLQIPTTNNPHWNLCIKSRLKHPGVNLHQKCVFSQSNNTHSLKWFRDWSTISHIAMFPRRWQCKLSHHFHCHVYRQTG